MGMRRTLVLSTSAALAMLLLGVAALLWTQQEAQALPPCRTDFCLDKTADPSTVSVGEQITFTITERCSFGFRCNSANLVDTLPSGVSIDSVDVHAPLDPGYRCTTTGNTVTCPAPREFNPNEPWVLTIVATTAQCGTFTNTASVFSTLASATYRVEGCPPTLPTTKAQCKKGGWEELGYPTQGRCISESNRRNH